MIRSVVTIVGRDLFFLLIVVVRGEGGGEGGEEEIITVCILRYLVLITYTTRRAPMSQDTSWGGRVWGRSKASTGGNKYEVQVGFYQIFSCASINHTLAEF